MATILSSSRRQAKLLTEWVPRPLRPIALLAPGGALLVTLYWLDFPASDSSVYPIHDWSTVGVIIGWWLMLIGLSLLSPSEFPALIALLSGLALATVSADNKTVTSSTLTPQLGVVGAALVLLLATSTAIVNGSGWRGRLVWSVLLAAVGGAMIATENADSSTPVVDSPIGEFLATLVAAPVFVGFRSAWRWRYGPRSTTWLVGCPWWGWVALISFFWAVNIAVQPLHRFGVPEFVAYGGAIAAVILAGVAAALAAPRLRAWSWEWLGLPRIGTKPSTEDSPAPAPPDEQLEWDGLQFSRVAQSRVGAARSPRPHGTAARHEFWKDWPGYLLIGCIAIVVGGSVLIFVFVLVGLSWQRAQHGDFVASIFSAAILAPIVALVVAAAASARRR